MRNVHLAGGLAEYPLQVSVVVPSFGHQAHWTGVSLQGRRLSAAPSTSGNGVNSSKQGHPDKARRTSASAIEGENIKGPEHRGEASIALKRQLVLD